MLNASIWKIKLKTPLQVANFSSGLMTVSMLKEQFGIEGNKLLLHRKDCKLTVK